MFFLTFLTFLGRKVDTRTFLKNITSFVESFWVSKGLFPKSPLCRGLGRTAPTFNAQQKSTALPCFLICHYMLELRSKLPSLTFLIRKVSKRISHRPHHFIWLKLLRFQRTFPEKSFVSGGWGGQPQY